MVILYFLQAIFTVLGTIAFLVFINGLLDAYHNRDKTTDPVEELKGDETYYCMGKERSKVNGHIVRRGPAPSGDWCLWDCQTGQMLYDYTQEQLMSKQDKLIQEAKELGWGFYYGTQVRHGDYFYNRMEKLIQKSSVLGGNAIIGVDIDYTMFSNNIICVIANGTSVVIEEK